MLNYVRNIHRLAVEMYYADTVTIQQWNPVTSTWVTTSASTPAHVQFPRASASSGDPDAASVEDQHSIVVFMRWNTVIDVGNQILWDGDAWTVNSVTGHRTAEVNRIAQCSKSQTALQSEMVSFRRRVHGAWIELGEFEMRLLMRSPGIQIPPREQTATSTVMRSVMIGGPESTVLEVGDWFGRDGLPGRILQKDDHEPDHIEFLYEMELAVP